MVERAFEILFVLALVAPPATLIFSACCCWRGHVNTCTASTRRSAPHRMPEHVAAPGRASVVFPQSRGISRAPRALTDSPDPFREAIPGCGARGQDWRSVLAASCR